MPHKRKATGGDGGFQNDALMGACASYYSTLSHAKQAPCRWLSRAIMALALALVDAGDAIAGLALRLACEGAV